MAKKHRFENEPPNHERFVIDDDNWKLAETALPVDDARVSSSSGDAIATRLDHSSDFNPVYDGQNQSAYIHESHHVKGKR